MSKCKWEIQKSNMFMLIFYEYFGFILINKSSIFPEILEIIPMQARINFIMWYYDLSYTVKLTFNPVYDHLILSRNEIDNHTNLWLGGKRSLLAFHT